MEQHRPVSSVTVSEYEPIDEEGEDNSRLGKNTKGHIDENVHAAASEENLVKEKQNDAVSATLLRQDAVMWIFSFYAVLVVASWILTCLLTYRPLPKGSYRNVYNSNHADFDSAWDYVQSGTPTPDPKQVYLTSRTWYKATETLQAIVALLTLSISAVICSKCAIVFLQKTQHRPTLRQALILSDKGWLNPRNWLFQFNSDRRRLISTSALYVFMAVTLIGAVIPPLQQVLVTQVTIKVPTNYQALKNTRTVDITDLLPDDIRLEKSRANSKLTVLTQETFATTFQSRPIFNLWIDSNTTMSCKDAEESFNQSPLQLLPHASNYLDGCQNYGDRPTQNPPFITHVAAFKNTGLIKQFVPRMNSTVTYTKIDESEFPDDCNDQTAGFYAEYSVHSDEASYSVKACMLEIDTRPPWKRVRDRQDIQERVYLQVQACVLAVGGCDGKSTFRTDANTTLGWFELPNYENGNQPGPLLQKDPLPCHDDACAVQLDQYSNIYKRESQVQDSVQLSSRRNVGPLTLTVLALFGQQSWLASQTASLNNPGSNSAADGAGNTQSGICSGSAPLANLGFSVSGAYDSELGCITVENDFMLRVQAPAEWLLQFLQPASMQIGLGSAVILASNVWLWSKTELSLFEDFSLYITSDLGFETIKPSMLEASMIVLSALWGIYLVLLFSLAYYSFSTRVWTKSLDGFTLLRMGTALRDKISLRIHPHEDEELSILDELPGWFGDGDPSEEVGQVELGAQDPLSPGRHYTSYARWVPWVERTSRFDQPHK